MISLYLFHLISSLLIAILGQKPTLSQPVLALILVAFWKRGNFETRAFLFRFANQNPLIDIFTLWTSIKLRAENLTVIKDSRCHMLVILQKTPLRYIHWANLLLPISFLVSKCRLSHIHLMPSTLEGLSWEIRHSLMKFWGLGFLFKKIFYY